MGTRRRFTDEFKREAIRLVGRPGVTMSSVARDLGINVSVLRRWVEQYNTARPHQGLGMATPAQRFWQATPAEVSPLRGAPAGSTRPDPGRGDGYWVARRASAVGVVCVNWQQICLGAAAAGRSTVAPGADPGRRRLDRDGHGAGPRGLR